MGLGRVITLFTIEMGAKIACASFQGEYPGAAGKGRTMSDMLSMTAGKIGHPIAFFVLMISDDGLLHSRCWTL